MVSFRNNENSFISGSRISVEFLTFFNRDDLVMFAVNDKGWLVNLSNLYLIEEKAFVTLAPLAVP